MTGGLESRVCDLADPTPGGRGSVTVVIPAYNRADLLGDALASVRAQTASAAETIVVDDGSTESLAAAIDEFPGVRLLRQDNLGTSRARNAGLNAATSQYVLFLDSDDALLPNAIADCLGCMADHPGAAVVYGGFVPTNAALEPVDRAMFIPIKGDPYHALLEHNCVQMLGAALFDREKLLEVGGFDPEVEFCEDYDLFLRLARNNSIASDPMTVARYRFHGGNRSAGHERMLAAALAVLERNRPAPGDRVAVKAYRRGRRNFHMRFAQNAWGDINWGSEVLSAKERMKLLRKAPVSSIAAATWQFAKRHLPERATGSARKVLATFLPAVGQVDFGDLDRRRPISRSFGYDRGTPIDRYYIEKFLGRSSADVKGRVLEVGSDDYSRKFGNVSRQDVLNIDPKASGATIVGDLSKAGTLPEGAFDCMVVTQTLQFIFDTKAAIEELYRGLRPGGVLLTTFPGVASVSRDEYRHSWYWSLTDLSAGKLFAEIFGPENFTVESYGNVYAATSFLHGLAVEDVKTAWLDRFDPCYPMIVAVRAKRPE